ncbi:MAG: carbonic anhydrase [Rhizomicrobium sp.]
MAWAVVGLALIPFGASAQWRTPWSYNGLRGPAHWGTLDPDYALCNQGRAQSPIDIEKTRVAPLPDLHFSYRPGPLTITNNGYTALRADYLPGNGNILEVGGKRYELAQFHFHHPSEERIHGKAYAMVLHLMHRDGQGRIVGVAVFVREGRANPAIAELWRSMPEQPAADHPIPGARFNPAALLPANRTYYSYQGSQTAPPCQEGVTWFVLKTPIEASAGQIESFAKLYPHDVRPVQPLDGRVVEESR